MLETIDHGRIRELRLSAPPANALRAELMAALRSGVSEAPASGAEALVISGAPGFFSAGLDVPHLLSIGAEGATETFKELFDLLRVVGASELPVAAAVTGHSPAGGAVIALFCDYRVMAAGKFKIGLNEVQVGLPIPALIFAALRRLVGSRNAERLAVQGRMLLPEEALAVGFVDEIAPVELVVELCIAWAEGLLSVPRNAMLATRRLARGDLHRVLESGDSELIGALTAAWSSEETQGAMTALVERLRAAK